MTMLNKWNYTGPNAWPERYGDDQSYIKAIEFLDGPGVLEDWGCGRGYARRFVKQAEYVGVDGSGPYADIKTDLTRVSSRLRANRKPDCDYILLRHVLEHNTEWRKILQNALQSARKKLCIVIFTPFQQRTRIIGFNEQLQVPDIGFHMQEFCDAIRASLTHLPNNFPCGVETIQSDTQYGQETLFYIDLETK